MNTERRGGGGGVCVGGVLLAGSEHKRRGQISVRAHDLSGSLLFCSSRTV